MAYFLFFLLILPTFFLLFVSVRMFEQNTHSSKLNNLIFLI